MDSTTAVPAQPGGKSGVLINRNFALLFAGFSISSIGDFVFTTTLVLWIAVRLTAGLSWSPLAVSGALLAASVPIFLVGPLAGVFVDRWNKRGTMLRAAVFQAVAVALLLGVSGIVPVPGMLGGQLPIRWTLGVIYGVVFLVNAANQFNNPASMALLGDIVNEPERARAAGLTQVVSALAVIIGPPVAALLFVFGVQWALLLDAASFVVAFGCVLLIRAPRAAVSVAQGERGHFAREFGQGFAFFFRSRVLVTLLIAALLAMLGAGALNALDVFFVTGKDYLNQPASLYGFAGAAQGVGILLGAIVASALAYKFGLTRTIWVAVLILGATIVAWSRMTLFIPALITLFIGGIAQAALNVAAGPLLLAVTPRELVGRVTAVLQPLITGASLISIALAGYLVSTVLVGFHASAFGVRFGPIDTIFLVAGGLIILSGLYAMVMWRGVRVAAPEADGAGEAGTTTPAPEAAPVVG
jgi:hypothetical protein